MNIASTNPLKGFFVLIFCAGISLMSLGFYDVRAQNAQPPCTSGETMETCVAVLNQKAPQLDNHAYNTDQEVQKLVEAVVSINLRLTEIENKQKWERGIWGFIVAMTAAIIGILSRRKTPTPTKE